MTRNLIIISAIVLSASSAHAYTRAQAASCYPDAVRLCGAPSDYRKMTPDQSRQVKTCMVLHVLSLSAKCLGAFGR